MINIKRDTVRIYVRVLNVYVIIYYFQRITKKQKSWVIQTITIL